MTANMRVSDPAQFVWWQSQKNSETGKFLQVIPTFPKFKMSNNEFRLALKYRGYVRVPGIIDGMKCCCKRHPAIDIRGHHLATACAVGGERFDTHNNLVGELNNILRYCGKRTKVEERRVFGAVDPNNNLRPDITIMEPDRLGTSKLLLDVSVTSPLTGFTGRVVEAGNAAKVVVAAKNAKYQASCSAAGFSFKAIVSESTGFMHKNVTELLLSLAKDASELKHIKATVLYNYFVKRIGFCLQRGIANAISKRLASVRSQCACKDSDPSFNNDVITNFDVVY